MFRTRPWSVLCIVIASLLVVAGCSDDDPVEVTAGDGTVLFVLEHSAGGQPLVLENNDTNFPYRTAAGNDFNVSELEYYVSGFRVHRADGSSYGVIDAHFRDEDDDATKTFTLSNVPPGTYTAVSFIMGLDRTLNQTDALLAFGYIRLTWPGQWGGGYHYLEMNGNYNRGGTTPTPHRTHTGRRFVSNTDGSPPGPDATEFHHFFTVSAQVTPFTVGSGETWSVTSVMDIVNWYANPAFDMETYFVDSASNIMVNLSAQQLLMQNGTTNVFTVQDAVKQ